MPYKASLKSGAPRKRPKPTHRVANARAYNQSLKRRGQLSLYCPEGDLKALFINGRPYVPGVSGRAPTYTNAYIELIVDSTGMNFGRASEWHRQKYGRDARRTPWSKVHLSIDPDMNIHAIAVTEDHVSDEAGLDAVLAVDANVDCVIADGAYYSIAQTEAWSSSGVLPVIPPPTNAVIHGQPTTRWHDHLVR
ncbi:hypothetical protein WK57_17530 [Burkholderia ubonensis]|uniref:Transposase IS4-like domain-containing protein n=1 Tax=Burkholderia ubonensis TaxID=101571 RepID=A0AA40UXA5_9BURK|nr:transposase [Burkholderia ubonensis]KWZ58326.1 hypothetical protein WK57_17530 [Burkholderia ubonensis]